MARLSGEPAGPVRSAVGGPAVVRDALAAVHTLEAPRSSQRPDPRTIDLAELCQSAASSRGLRVRSGRTLPLRRAWRTWSRRSTASTPCSTPSRRCPTIGPFTPTRPALCRRAQASADLLRCSTAPRHLRRPQASLNLVVREACPGRLGRRGVTRSSSSRKPTRLPVTTDPYVLFPISPLLFAAAARRASTRWLGARVSPPRPQFLVEAAQLEDAARAHVVSARHVVAPGLRGRRAQARRADWRCLGARRRPRFDRPRDEDFGPAVDTRLAAVKLWATSRPAPHDLARLSPAARRGCIPADPNPPRQSDHKGAVEETLAALRPRPVWRVASPPDTEGGTWMTHAWVKEAILLYFALRTDGDDRGRPVRVPRQDPAEARSRRPPACASSRPASCATARSSSAGAIVHARLRQHRRARRRGHDGRHLGHRRELRADRPRRAPLRAASASAGARAAGRAARDHRGRRFIGSRASSSRACTSSAKPVIGAGVVLTASTAILDVTGPELVEHRGRVPARSVVIPGSRPKRFPAGEFGVPCALIIGTAHAQSTDRKVRSTRRFATSGCRCDATASSQAERLDATLLGSARSRRPSARSGPSATPSPRAWPGIALAAPIRRYGDSIVVPVTRGTGGPRIALAGHLDVVRTAHDGPPRIEGDRSSAPAPAT